MWAAARVHRGSDGKNDEALLARGKDAVSATGPDAEGGGTRLRTPA